MKGGGIPLTPAFPRSCRGKIFLTRYWPPLLQRRLGGAERRDSADAGARGAAKGAVVQSQWDIMWIRCANSSKHKMLRFGFFPLDQELLKCNQPVSRDVFVSI